MVHWRKSGPNDRHGVDKRHLGGGKRHAMPCHHNPLEEYLIAYLDGAGLRGDPKGPLFRTIGRGTGQLTRTVLPQGRHVRFWTLFRIQMTSLSINR